MNAKIIDTQCPLCGENNACGNLVSDSSKNQCWCASESVSFSAEFLAQVPKEQQGKACICKSCAEKFQKSVARF